MTAAPPPPSDAAPSPASPAAASTEPPPPLELRALGHRFEGAPRAVLRDVSLALAPGELLAVLGASGSGKTTLLRAVAGLLTASAGEVRMDGASCAKDGREAVPAERRRVGLVFQDYALFPHLSVRENVGFGVAAAERAARVRALLAADGLGELAALLDRRPAELSGGQQQRVALARALAVRPRLLLLDEPFANLDARLREDLGAELRRVLAAVGGSGALLVTHDRAEALGLADRVAVLGPPDDEPDDGVPTLLQVGAPEAVYRSPRTRRVAALTGPAHLLDGLCEGASARTALGAVPLRAPAEGERTLVVRPEQLGFALDPAGPAAVEARRFHGSWYAIDLATPAGRLTASLRIEQAPPIGARGRVEVSGPVWAIPG